MVEFRLDHVVIRTPERDGLLATIGRATGLPILQGYAAGGVIHSRGVRFANGPFLDIFQADAPSTALILGGSVDKAGSLAAARGWTVRIGRREDTPVGRPVFPWSMAFFRRGQGLLTQISVIDYVRDPAAWADPDYSGDLYRPGLALEACASLSRVWVCAEDTARAERDLAALGYAYCDDAVSAFWPHAGRRLSGPVCDLVLFEGPDTVARLDIVMAGGPPREIVLSGGPRLVVDEEL